MLETRAPVPAPVPAQHRQQLDLRDRLGIGAQPRQNLAQFGRQHLAGIHRQQLADLHGRPAQLRQLLGDLEDIGWSQQKITEARALALRELKRAIEQHAASHPGRHAAKPNQPRQAACGNGAAAISVIEIWQDWNLSSVVLLAAHFSIVSHRHTRTEHTTSLLKD